MGLSDFLVIQVTTFMMVLTRMAGILMFGPMFSSESTPQTIRFYIALAMTFVMTPVVASAQPFVGNMVDLVIALAGEMLIGFVLGNILRFVFQGLQVAGQVVGQQMGLALANVVNPAFDDQASTIGVLYVTIATLLFLAIGAHREMFAAVLDTFRILPPGRVLYSDFVRISTLDMFHESMQFAVRVAAPTTVALLLTEIAMGFVGRTVPQLNVITIGFAIRILVGVFFTLAAMYAVGLGTVDQFFLALDYGNEALEAMAVHSAGVEEAVVPQP